MVSRKKFEFLTKYFDLLFSLTFRTSCDKKLNKCFEILTVGGIKYIAKLFFIFIIQRYCNLNNFSFHFPESQFGGMALCTNEGIRFIVNTKEPYTGAVYAAERFSTCSQIVENAKQIAMLFPPPTVSSDCGTTIRVR